MCTFFNKLNRKFYLFSFGVLFCWILIIFDYLWLLGSCPYGDPSSGILWFEGVHFTWFTEIEQNPSSAFIGNLHSPMRKGLSLPYLAVPDHSCVFPGSSKVAKVLRKGFPQESEFRGHRHPQLAKISVERRSTEVQFSGHEICSSIESGFDSNSLSITGNLPSFNWVLCLELRLIYNQIFINPLFN